MQDQVNATVKQRSQERCGVLKLHESFIITHSARLRLGNSQGVVVEKCDLYGTIKPIVVFGCTLVPVVPESIELYLVYLSSGNN